jgi:hypothetical protein
LIKMSTKEDDCWVSHFASRCLVFVVRSLFSMVVWWVMHCNNATVPTANISQTLSSFPICCLFFLSPHS